MVLPSSYRSSRPARRHGRTLARAITFLVAFTVFLLLVVFGYLLPALNAARDATPDERKRLAAQGSLVLLIVLFVLFAGLALTFRLGRFFFPRNSPGRLPPTPHVDVWAEAGRRMKTPPPDDDANP